MGVEDETATRRIACRRLVVANVEGPAPPLEFDRASSFGERRVAWAIRGER